MEYQFTHTMHGVVAKCSMDHEAFADWLNTEIVPRPETLSAIFKEIGRCQENYPNNYEAIFEGREYTLYLNNEEVIVKANSMEMPFDELEDIGEGLNFYDAESVASCGLEDFEAFLIAYHQFITIYH